MRGAGRSHHRDRIAVVAILLIAPLGLVGCPSDRPAPSVGSPAFGTDARTGGLQLRNILAVSAESGAATLVGTIINESGTQDALVGLRLHQGTTEIGMRRVPIPVDASVTLGVATSLDRTSTPAVLAGSHVIPGHVVEVTFLFERAEPVPVSVLVFDREGALRDVPVPSP